MTLTRFAPVAALLPVLMLALAAPAWAEKIPLAQLSAYLNGLTTAEAAFTQVNADGSKSTGKLYLKRPGRMRFEYTDDKTLVLASGGQVAIFDPKSNQIAEQYPLKRTPLNLILADRIDLAQARMVVGHEAEGANTAVVAQDPQNPEYGTIRLVFSANPVTLRRWVITDDAGAKTVVILDQLKPGVDPGSLMFSIVAETEARKN
ncbi:outer membrane lipoprotein carrier protein LolA [Rhodobacter capsulatus]|uniref:LolA family protein n=1 Tax=Rhodobacter capsulatus TaxID=1061 RepID=UPI0006DBDE34|nr:outer membrane lipoprotein carrier protein LolA [Rhodobacter capsulatus]KQB15408.1 cell envelope biogenesis protein LolA [Rhodobacter capsulatus]KQB16587.1 cell envelope biogenesis protein LolA [Rhodobacter capsulatus]PZX22290.1 outer membrane lipoprotein-sorting protein [Rhodobacter capsulatus]QNR63061.1 outer membrane lipoprotein carrier protein LolA [Rhodobacter capsulatus]